MILIEKYLSGDTQSVYDEIESLGQEAFLPGNFEIISQVLNETFQRVRHNLEQIYAELRSINYQFIADSYEEEESKPLVLSSSEFEKSFRELGEKVTPWYIPLSLQYFYKVIGHVDFSWNWTAVPDIPWEGADPLVISSISFLLDWGGNVYSDGRMFLSPDDLQKDNVSGNAYYLTLSKHPTVDGIFTGYDIPFIDYLRLTFENGGFTNADNCDYASLNEFCDRVRPKLLPI